ncbi:hypothetical protein BS47DRAFT_1481925 [Hydnum rufescens UP504]|uniref:Zn(2)-C6 fungal-type domain-containing protein n=1 Tax=Hydnum rufescens UP504 TaxID=1448309 RepID=A0A9P6E1R5_9AGAM|nr:hypothetical protein BS47DRAFT_1481925 [Hydnum rufescens UP504]
MKETDQHSDDNFTILRFPDFDGTLGGDLQIYPIWILPRKLEKIDVAFIWLVTNGVPFFVIFHAPSALYPKSDFLSRSRKIKCDGAHPVCSTCIRRSSPQCDYDDEPRRRGPGRHRRVQIHHDFWPLSIRPRRSQKRSSNDVGASPATPSSTQSPPDTTPHVSGIISRTGVSKRPPTPPKGSLDSSRLYPSPSTFGVFQERSGNETLTHDLFGGSLSMHPSHSYLHHSGTRPPTSNDPLPSPSTGIGDQSGSQSFLSDPSDRTHPNFSRRSIVDTQLHYPYLSDSDPRSSSESSHTFPMQVATEKEEVEQEIVRSPYIFAPSSFPMAMGTNVAHTDPSVEATNHIPPFAYSTNFLPMAASRMRQSRQCLLGASIVTSKNKTLSDDEWKMAEKIRRVLAYPHSVQQLMSGEATPILSGTLPAFQSLQNRWEEHMAKNPDVTPFVLEGMEQLNQYHEKAGKTRAYVIAMALNPAIKLSFIIRNWDPIEAEMAVEWIKDELVQYRAGDSNTTPNGTSATEIHENARIMLGLVDADDDEDGENDETSIDHEYLAYMSAKRTPRSKPILAFWQENEHIYPTWFRMAMDYLPIQAFVGPPELMEALQMLKFMLKKKRLDFMDGWKTPITDMQVDQDDDVNTLQDILGAEGTRIGQDAGSIG